MLNRRRFLRAAAAVGSTSLLAAQASAQQTPAPSTAPAKIDLRNAVIVIAPGERPLVERTAVAVLTEEVFKRTGIKLQTSTTFPASWPKGRPSIVLSPQLIMANHAAWTYDNGPETKPEGFRLYTHLGDVWIRATDSRGILFGVGRLLRELDWAQGELSLTGPVNIGTSPAYAIRGHQLGYRAQANSYDAWNAKQFEQYIRELTYFGTNAIEAIPFQDERKTPVLKFPRREMNKAMGDICHRYGLDYWHWLPAEFDLSNTAERNKLLGQCDQLFHDCPIITGIFFPGGDPGNNPPELVLPFLEDLAKRMLPVHPNARLWLSLQLFNKEQIEYSYQYIEREKPNWLGGLICGPSSPDPAPTRLRLPKQYKLRLYPDLTHNKLCQYEVPEWDQAYALTLGREATNPRPAEFAAIHNRYAPFSIGFISYSDGIHDDVNKVVYSAMSWDPKSDPRDIVIHYARAYFEPKTANEAADGILALERNWHGPLADNGSVEGTLLLWRDLERKAPQLKTNWRWQMNLLRANYDAFVRRRLINETKLELEANQILIKTPVNPAELMADAMKILNRAVDQPVSPDLRARIADLCEQLYRSIGLQTSVPKYHAIGAERGAVLDFIDYPLNNRWWLEDEFKKVAALPTLPQRSARLVELGTWENPGPGSFYDAVGNIAKSPHVVRAESSATDPGKIRQPGMTYWWWDQGKSRARLPWQVTTFPAAMLYDGLAENGTYVVQSCGYGQALMRINGDLITPTNDAREAGQRKQFPVEAKYLKGGKLVLTWDRPKDEGNLNWRQKSRLAEVWLIRKG